MATISLKIRKRDASKSIPVYLEITFAGRRLRFSTGICVSDERNFKDGHVMPKETNSKAKNVKLAKLTSELEMFLARTRTFDEVKTFVKDVLSDTVGEQLYLINVFDEFIKTKTKASTISTYILTKKKIIAFDKNATLEVVDRKWLLGFEQFLQNDGMTANGRAVYLRNVRSVFNYSIDEGYTKNYPFRKFKIKTERTEKRSLTLDQLQALRDCECEPFQALHRDMFMLMFYLIGINAADLFALPVDAINKQGRIVYHRAKTNRLYSIKVEPEALEIIKRHRGTSHLLSPLDRYKSYKDYMHHMNKSLKTIGMQWQAGIGWGGQSINADLTSYWSRHTWATIAFKAGVPKDIISLSLGHSFGLSVTDVYIDYSNAQIDIANRKVLDYIKENVSDFRTGVVE